MQRINVIGTTGSGKSTFARALAKRLQVKYVHMDQLYWQKDWTGLDNDTFCHKIAQALDEPAWVLDGNYSRTQPVKWQSVDTIVWIDMSFWRTFWQLFKRTLHRGWTKQELWPGTGNRESFRRALLSRESIFLWLFKHYRRNKKRYAALAASPELKGVNVIRITHARQIRDWLELGIVPE